MYLLCTLTEFGRFSRADSARNILFLLELCRITLTQYISTTNCFDSFFFKLFEVTPNGIIQKKKKDNKYLLRTCHGSSKESRLRQPNLVLLTTSQPPLLHRRAGQPPRPTQPDSGRAWDGLSQFPVSKDHRHDLESAEDPGKTSQQELPELPGAKFAGESRKHLVHIHPLFAADGLRRLRSGLEKGRRRVI